MDPATVPCEGERGRGGGYTLAPAASSGLLRGIAEGYSQEKCKVVFWYGTCPLDSWVHDHCLLLTVPVQNDPLCLYTEVHTHPVMRHSTQPDTVAVCMSPVLPPSPAAADWRTDRLRPDSPQ